MNWTGCCRYGYRQSKKKAMELALLVCMMAICDNAMADDKAAAQASDAAAMQKMPPSDQSGDKKYSAQFIVNDRDGKPIPNYPYRMQTEDGQIWRGVTDEDGKTQRIWSASPQQVNLYYDDGGDSVKEPNEDKSYSTQFVLRDRDGKPVSNYPYVMEAEDGQIWRGLTGKDGRTQVAWATHQNVNLHYDDKGNTIVKATIPDPYGGASVQKVRFPAGEKYSAQFIIRDVDDNPLPNSPYVMTAEDGQTWRGLTDKDGKTERVWISPQRVDLSTDMEGYTRDGENSDDDADGEGDYEGISYERIPVNDMVVVDETYPRYDYPDYPAILLLRHPMGAWPTGQQMHPDTGVLEKYATAKDDDVIGYTRYGNEIRDNMNTWGAEAQKGVITIRKKDVVSLDDLPAWKGAPPVRTSFRMQGESSLPFDTNYTYVYSTGVFEYVAIDAKGYEIDLRSGKRSGYAFYQLLDMCYLASIKKPRTQAIRWEHGIQCQKNDYSLPDTIDTSSHPWINIMNQDTSDIGKPVDLVEIPGSKPIKPLIFSDYPIMDDGRVSKGQAMCMADCPDGMLMKLLHEGQSIWGKSGRK